MGTDVHIFSGRTQLSLAFGLLAAFVANLAMIFAWL
jgi:hypothetical protein